LIRIRVRLKVCAGVSATSIKVIGSISGDSKVTRLTLGSQS
jgi:hypothetical protein